MDLGSLNKNLEVIQGCAGLILYDLIPMPLLIVPTRDAKCLIFIKGCCASHGRRKNKSQSGLLCAQAGLAWITS